MRGGGGWIADPVLMRVIPAAAWLPQISVRQFCSVQIAQCCPYTAPALKSAQGGVLFNLTQPPQRKEDQLPARVVSRMIDTISIPHVSPVQGGQPEYIITPTAGHLYTAPIEQSAPYILYLYNALFITHNIMHYIIILYIIT